MYHSKGTRKMRTHASYVALAILLAALFCLPATSSAQSATMDAPHDPQGCLSCHDMTAFSEPAMIPSGGHTPLDMDDSLFNNVCWGCHNGAIEPAMGVHSSLTTSNKYGNWTVGCSVCHNQHRQEQNRTYGSTYGKFVRAQIDLSRIVDDTGAPIKSGKKTVKFLGATGPNSFADGDPAAIDGICEVCHTQTQHWTNDGTKANLGVHAGLGGTNCMSCHVHGDGFKADCSACHDFPPGALVSNPGTTGSATAGAHIEHYTNQNISCDSCHFENFTNNEHNNGAPLSITIGFGPDTPIPQGGSYDGQAGVNYDASPTTPVTTVSATGTKTCSSIYCHGNYPGSGLNASPVWDNPATGDCGTCHGASNVADSAPDSGSHEKHADVDQTIKGAGQSTFNRGYQCTFCHTGIVGGTGPASYTIADKAKHVNGTVDWAFDATEPRLSASSTYGAASGTETPTDGVGPNRLYSTCNNIYCHSIVQTSTGGALTPNSADYKTPTWGGTVGCGDCHKHDGGHNFTPDVMDSGSHTAHLAYGFTTSWQSMKCDMCHRMGTAAISGGDCNSCHANGEKTDHVDGQVDVAFETTYVGGNAAYSGTPTPADGYSTCATTYCHGNGTAVSTGTINANTSPAWGTAGPLACDSCHDGTATGPAYANGSPKANSHSKHVSGGLTCDICHYTTTNDGTTIASKVTHVNRAYNVNPAPSTSLTYTYNAAGGTCSSTYCHGAGSPQWGGTVNCGDCHGVNNTLAQSHQTHYGVATAGDWNSGLNANATAGAYGFNCVNCHDNAENPSGAHGDGPQSDPQTADIFFDTATVGYGTSSYTKGAEHASSPDPNGFKYTQGTCDNTYCHSDGTVVSTGTIVANTSPAWGSAGPLACNSCHGNGPSYANGTPKANTHVEHINAGATCDDCHNATTTTGNTITDRTKHVNKTYDVVAGNGESFTYTFVAGGQSTCSSVSCHGGTFTAQWGHQPHNVSYDSAVDLSQVSMPGDNPCGDCHNGNNADGNGTPLDSWTDILSEHLGSCATCHAYTDDGNGTPLEADVNATIAGGGPATCVDCHQPKLDPAPTSDHGGHDDGQFGWDGSCDLCHSANPGAPTEAVVRQIHSNNCDLCHQTGGPYNKTTEKLGDNLWGDARAANGAADAVPKFDPTVYTCTLCHIDPDATQFHGLTIAAVTSRHQLSSNSSGGYDCETCHSGDAANEQLNRHMPADTVANCAAVCHNNTTPSNTSGIVAKTVINDVTFNDPAPNKNDTKCEDCHAAKGDFKRHGLTDDDSVSDGIGDGTGGVVFHDNLGNANGIAPTYSGKLASYGGVKATEYNCGQCHSADPDSVDVDGDPNISALEAMQLHTLANGSGHGNCLTCHGFANVSDEITAGIGGTVQYCEDCHATANGNGPSGKAMYQYDGVRHHATDHAQAGECTWCHADPRPPSTYPAGVYAHTADVNGGASGGGSYTTGWVTDYATADPASPGSYPTNYPIQAACRLCHTNYETFSVNVFADQNGNTNYGETVDLHGYHINGQATGYNNTGLTVYANDYDNTNVHSSKSYPSGNTNRGLRGVNQVTQSAVHRIDPVSGTGKIFVDNYGACMGCHSIQIHHAAPRPTLDFEVAGTNNNGLTYDTLRYAPGRSIFNLLPDRNFPTSDDCGQRGPGSGDNTDDWDQHCEPEKYRNKTWNGDRGQRLMDNTFNKNPSTNPANDEMFFDVYPTANWTQYPIPGDAITNYENLSGIPTDGTLYNGHGGGVPVFTNMPTINVPDDITVNQAEWDGSTLTVQATNTYGCASTLTFVTSNGSCSGEPITMACAAGVHTSSACNDLTFSDGVTLTISTDSANGGDDVTAAITYNPPIPTVAIDDSYTVKTSQVTQLLVLANDQGSNNTVISTDDTNLDPNCSTAVAGGGTRVDITCGVTEGAMGSFDYVVSGDVGSDTGTVTITTVANTAPTITVNQPDGVGDTGTAGGSFTINYDADDADGDPISVDFYYDNNNAGQDGTAIASCQNLTATGTGLTCNWTNLPAGTWYVYGIVDDGTTTTTDYSSGTVVVTVPPVTRSGNWATAIDTPTLSYTVPAGTNRVLVVYVSAEDANATTAVSDVTYAGTGSDTAINQIQEGPNNNYNNTTYVGYWVLGTGAASGPNNITVTWSSPTPDNYVIAAATYEYVDQASPIYANTANSSTSNAALNLDVNNPANGRVLFGVEWNGETNSTNALAGFTEQFDVGTANPGFAFAVGERDATTAGTPVNTRPSGAAASSRTTGVSISLRPQ
ncbi:MAG: hypothetical protein Kow0089_19430 [Desulfobulbaceae bacterium]